MFSLYGCTKDISEIATTPPFTEASYKVEVTGKWKSPEFTVPGGVHFTTFVGMVHNSNAFLWQEGKLASVGVENVAEVGSTTRILTEIDSIIASKGAISRISVSAPGPTGISVGNIYCNTNYSYISFESMIAPSPDWFVGLSSFNLLKNGQWIADTTLNLYVYDAGTEEGDVFGYANPATEPRQNIRLLNVENAMVLANGNNNLAPIASVRFVKQ
jgi:hypothetical protein